jgi:type II secretory pathway pseudopilin PulG
MRKSRGSNNGFSLAEVLLAIGTISVGMLFIAGVFPIGIHFATIASERTIAAVVADEAFAKIRLCAMGDPNIPFDDIDLTTLVPDELRDYTQAVAVNPVEFSYPSDPNMNFDSKHFYWSALCRRADRDPSSRLVQVTVFVSRKVGSGTMYQGMPGNWPVPVPVEVDVYVIPGSDELFITGTTGNKTFINDGCTIVDNRTGRIYRVLERYKGVPPIDQVIKLDRPWRGGALPGLVWVVPPPVGGGRYPCIAVYQRVIRF